MLPRSISHDHCDRPLGWLAGSELVRDCEIQLHVDWLPWRAPPLAPASRGSRARFAAAGGRGVSTCCAAALAAIDSARTHTAAVALDMSLLIPGLFAAHWRNHDPARLSDRRDCDVVRDDWRLHDRRQLDRPDLAQWLEFVRRHQGRRIVCSGGDERAARDLLRRVAGAPPRGRLHGRARHARRRPLLDAWLDGRLRCRPWTQPEPDAPRRLVSPSWASEQRRSPPRRLRPLRPLAAARTGRAASACAVSRQRGPGRPDPHRRSSGPGRPRRSPRRFAAHSYPYPTDASFFFSSRRASETRHLTVPKGMPSIDPICSYE